MDILDVDLYQFELVYRDCFRKVVQKKEKGVVFYAGRKGRAAAQRAGQQGVLFRLSVPGLLHLL